MNEPQDDYDASHEAATFAERAVLFHALNGMASQDAFCGLTAQDFTGLRRDIARILIEHQGPPLHATAVCAMIPGATRLHMLEVAECEGAHTAPANLLSLIRTVESQATARTVREHAAKLLNGAAENPGEVIAKIAAATNRQSGIGWAANDPDLLAFLAADYPEPPSLIGGGLLARGDLAILYGRGGLGKSYLALQLALSLARGNPWLGLPGPERPMRVGYVARELIGYRLQLRMRHLIGVEGSTELDRNVRLISLSEMTQRPNLLDPACVRDAVAWARHRELDLMILDPLARFHLGSEVEDAPAIMAACDDIRARTDCAVMLVHHERKAPTGKRADEDDLDSLRGHTVFRDMPTVLLRLVEANGRKTLRVAKTNNAAEPPPIYLAPHPSGHGFEVAESPEQVANENLARVSACLDRHPDGISRRDIQRETGLGDRAVQRHLETLQAEKFGPYRSPLYRAIATIATQGSLSRSNHNSDTEIDGEGF